MLFPVDAAKSAGPSVPRADAVTATPLLIPFPSPLGVKQKPQLIPVATPPHVVPVVHIPVARNVASAPRPPPLKSAPRVPVQSAPRQPMASAPRGLSSLIPDDVLQEYEREVLFSEREAHDAAGRDIVPVAEPVSEAAEVPSVEHVGAVTESPADEVFAAQSLGKVSLFEGLTEESLQNLVRGARQLDFPAGEYLFVEGDPAASFLVITEGTIEILRQRESREVALRHMSVGEPVGLFGLFSGAQRAACARAIGDVQALEIPSDRLQALLDADDALHTRLLRFYRERLMEGFLGSTRIFSEVDSIARARIIGRFMPRDLNGGETLVQPGEVTNLIAVVTHGELVIAEKQRAGVNSRKLTVGQGEFVALTAALSGIPTRVRLGCDAPASVMVLNQKELFELLRDYPALRNLPARLTRHAQQLDRDLFSGHTGIPGL